MAPRQALGTDGPNTGQDDAADDGDHAHTPVGTQTCSMAVVTTQTKVGWWRLVCTARHGQREPCPGPKRWPSGGSQVLLVATLVIRVFKVIRLAHRRRNRQVLSLEPLEQLVSARFTDRLPFGIR